MYARLEDITDKDMQQMGKYFGTNPYIRAVQASLEPFSKGHFQMRIVVDVDVSGTRQLKLESNTLAENLTLFDPDAAEYHVPVNVPEGLLEEADEGKVHAFLVNVMADMIKESAF
jgi:hypothetical protein